MNPDEYVVMLNIVDLEHFIVGFIVWLALMLCARWALKSFW
jgi:hypothetical protein